MTSEEFVKSHLPKAKAEKHTTNRGESYYLIRDGRATMYLASGETKAKAWKNAKEYIVKFLEKSKQK